MEIVKGKVDKQIELRNAKTGDVVSYDGRYYLVVDDTDFLIDLESGAMIDADDTEMVTPVKAKLIVEAE